MRNASTSGISLTIIGPSMGKNLPIGSRVHISGYQEELPRVGDVVAFMSGDEIIVHRLILKLPGSRYVHLGDGSTRAGIVSRSAILGSTECQPITLQHQLRAIRALSRLPLSWMYAILRGRGV